MATNKDKPGTVRRVYVLDTELADRIVEFQNDMGLPSEAEAARRLLDEALKSRDTYKTLLSRLQAKLKEVRFLSDAATILLGHPQVTGMWFEKDTLKFHMTNGYACKLWANGNYEVEDEDQRVFDRFPKKEPASFGRAAPALEDDIPF